MEDTTRDLVVQVVQEHAESLLRTARRYAGPADAEDAYQRALEIFVKSAHRLDPDTAHRWLHVVVRNEALALRKARVQLVTVDDEAALDALDDGRATASVEERSVRFDELSRAAEALQRLKPQEVAALWLKAQGLSYGEIAERQGWTYTKVNRCITEGRRAFLRRYAGIEAGEECERWSPVLSAMADGEASPKQLLAARPHLRNCPSCRSTLAAMRRSTAAAAAVLPPALPLAAEPEAASGAVARLAELAASLHDRAAGVAIKAQAAVEATTVGKLAAVVASTAALAGGGVAVERQLGGDPARAEPPAAEATRVAGPTTPLPQPSGAASPSGPRQGAASPSEPRGGDARAPQAPAEAAFAPEAAAAAPSEPAAPPSAPGRAPGGAAPEPRGAAAEFGFVPAP